MNSQAFLDTNTTEGWLYPGAVYVTGHLLDAQQTLGVPGACVEIGVYKGKYLSFLAESGRPTFGLDVFLFGQQDETQANVPGATLHRINSRTITDLREITGEVAFASVDGDHSADGVAHDLGIVEAALSPGGIVAVDDMFSGVSPAVAEGFFRFMDAGSTLRPVAFCDNKLFMTTPGYDELYNISLRVALSADPGPLGEKWRAAGPSGAHPAMLRPLCGGTLLVL